jgi:hypothetical protein
MTKEKLIEWIISKGFTPDKYGHYQKENLLAVYRFKIQDISVRYEKRIEVCGKNEWIKISSGYLKNLTINEDGLLRGMKR